MKTYIGNIVTPNGQNFVTAVNGGGLGGLDYGPGVVALHTDATTASTWETFKIILQPGSTLGPGMNFALQTSSGINYITAINGGGIGGPDDATCPIHTDATTPGPWETFTLMVDDSVNPPTAKIVPFVVLPLTPVHYLTAVEGGGIGGPNTQPVHSDATSVEAWEKFSFRGAPVAAPDPNSITINFNTNVNGPEDGNIAGSITLVLLQDGTFNFSGQMNNSNHLPNNMNVALAVVSSKGTVFMFTASGSIDANLPWDNNNWSWSNTGINTTIQSDWGDLTAGYTWYYNVSASLDLGDTVSALLGAIKTGVGIIQGVVAVVGALS